MRTLVAALTVALLVTHAIVQAQMPSAGPEHKRLAYFVGTWNLTGQAQQSPMGPGGPVTLKETCEAAAGGFAIVCRSEGKGPMGPTKATAIMGYDAEKKTYTYTAAESNMPVIHATGQVEGPTWTWTTVSNMAGQQMTTRVVIKEGGPNSYEMAMEMSMDGKKFAPMMSGKVTRAGS